MNEQMARLSQPMAIHLFYASIVWLAAWMMTSLQRGSATTKYWIWVGTSLNFLLPLNVIPERFWPSRIAWFTPRSAILSRSFALSGTACAVWVIGAAVMLTRLLVRMAAERRAHQTFIPAVRGLLRQRISLPIGVEGLLTPDELHSVLIHERTHARRRDNLIGFAHEMSLCIFWFHPLVWMTGSRLALYRELSCDESVTRQARGEDLISALGKLASREPASLLHASASSFVTERLKLLSAPPARKFAISVALAVAFAAVLLCAAAGPVAEAAAAAACARTHGVIK